MKLLWVLCNESIAEEVKELLDALPASGYTVWQGILGTSLDGGTRWGDAVWPGKNWACRRKAPTGGPRSMLAAACCRSMPIRPSCRPWP